MSYKNINGMPAYMKKYPNKIRRMMLYVYNSTYKKVLKETKSKKKAEQRATKAMNSVVKKNMEKFGYSRYGHSGYMSYLVDLYLNRLQG